MSTIVITGTQWGDEGKGKIVDYLASQADTVVRYQGGCNAGHTVVAAGEEYKLRLLPSRTASPLIPRSACRRWTPWRRAASAPRTSVSPTVHM